jgi:hypothetical protein
MIAVALTMKKMRSKNTMSIMGDMSSFASSSGIEREFLNFDDMGFLDGMGWWPGGASCAARPLPMPDQTSIPSGILA